MHHVPHLAAKKRRKKKLKEKKIAITPWIITESIMFWSKKYFLLLDLSMSACSNQLIDLVTKRFLSK